MYGETFTFCPNCGAVTLNNGTCSNCGYIFDENADDFKDLEKDVIYDDLASVNKDILNDSNPQKAVNGNNVAFEANNAAGKRKKEKKDGGSKAVMVVIIVLVCFAVAVPLVIVVLGLLAAIFVPAFLKYTILNNQSYNYNPYTPPTYNYNYDVDDYLDDDDDDDYDYDVDDYVPQSYVARDWYNLTEEIDFSEYTDNADMYDYENNLSSDIFYNNQFILHVPTGHYNMDRDSYVGPYYDSFSESYQPLYGYDVDRRYMQFSGQISNGISMNAYVGYYELNNTGLSNEDELNKEIYDKAMYSVLKTIDQINNGEVTEKLYVYVDSTIVYNDDKKMSIIVDTSIMDAENNNQDVYLDAINIDVASGQILAYEDIVEYDENIGDFFMERSEDQNGYSVVVNGIMTSDDIKDILNNPDSAFCFFTPIGLEIGINYEDADSGNLMGWSTISIMEYNDYVEDQFKDMDTSVGLSDKRYDFELNDSAPVITDDGEEL